MRAREDRQSFVRELTGRLDDLADIRESSRTRTHVIEIVQACLGHPEGLSALAATVTLFAPKERAALKVAALARSLSVLAVVPYADRRRVKDLLQQARPLDIETLWYDAADETASLPAVPPRTLGEAFDQLSELNARIDGLPPALAFVEYVAARLTGAIASDLQRWNDRQASLLGLAENLGRLRAVTAASPAPRPAQPCLVVQLAEHGIDSGRYVLSSWVQYRPGRWNPERGADRIVTLETVESVVEELLDHAETAWGKQPGRASLEFVLPTSLLNVAVDWWLLNSGSPEAAPLCLDYPIVVRSLERMRALNYHRLWRNRWEELLSASTINAHWAPADNADSGGWNARLRADESITAVILGEPPAPSPGARKTLLSMALRAGVPVLIWDRREEPCESFREVVNSLISGSPLTLASRVRDLRSQAAIADAAAGSAHIGRHLTVLVDDPNHLVDITPYAALDTNGHAKENLEHG